MKYFKFMIFSFFAYIISTQSSFAEMKLSSESIVDGKIQKEHACRKKGGKDKSPHLSLSGIPNGTKSITIIMDDPDAMKPAGKIWVHWNVFNIPVSGESFSLPSGKKPEGTIGKGHKGSGYKGMCPPDGKHTYRIAIYAQKEDVKAKASGFSAVKYTLERFEKDFSGSIIEKINITGDFK